MDNVFLWHAVKNMDKVFLWHLLSACHTILAAMSKSASPEKLTDLVTPNSVSVSDGFEPK